jgi:hypothetical protein
MFCAQCDEEFEGTVCNMAHANFFYTKKGRAGAGSVFTPPVGGYERDYSPDRSWKQESPKKESPKRPSPKKPSPKPSPVKEPEPEPQLMYCKQVGDQTPSSYPCLCF